MGPTARSKTTLVRQITTELLPTSGEVQVFGHDVVSEPNVVKGYMGVMPQKPTSTRDLRSDTTCASSPSCAAYRAKSPLAAPSS